MNRHTLWNCAERQTTNEIEDRPRPRDRMGSCSGKHEAAPLEVVLYLIRHGEAAHNILEAEAKSKARAEAVARGMDPESKECKDAIEKARKAVLQEQERSTALEQSVKEKEQRVRQSMEENDLLQFNNERLEKRVAILLKEIDELVRSVG